MKKILYLIDDINYKSGAQKVTLFQMQQLQREYDIYMLSLSRPKAPIEFLDCGHMCWAMMSGQKQSCMLSLSKTSCGASRYSLKEKSAAHLLCISLLEWGREKDILAI